MQNRIKELRKSLGLSQDEFGRRLGFTRGAITNLEYGKTEAKPLFVDLVCRTYGVNREWLVDGVGPMFPPSTREEEIAKFIGEALRDEPGSFKLRLISALSKLDAEAWEALERFAAQLVEAQADGKEKEQT